MRTFSEDDARDVFARAARDQQAAHDAADSGEGLTLDELQEIGRASGLDPAFVAAAAAGLDLRASAPTEARTLLGMPTKVQRSRILPGPLSDDAWGESVEAFRTLFGGPGTAGQIGRVRDWTSPPRSGWAGALTTRLTVRPQSGGQTDVHIEQHGMKTNVWGVIGTGGAVAAMALLPILLWATGDTNGTGVFVFAAMFVLVGLVLGIGGAVWARRSAKTAVARFDAALDRIDLLARTKASPARLGAEAPDLGDDARLGALVPDALVPDTLPDAPTEARTPSSRTRTR